MTLRAYIPVEKNQLPERFEIPFGNISYIFRVDYNKSQNIFTVDLYNLQNNPIVLGESLRLNEKLWQDIIDPRLPSIDIIPMDESGQETEITFENFGNTVFLCIDDLSPNYDIPKLERSN